MSHYNIVNTVCDKTAAAHILHINLCFYGRTGYQLSATGGEASFGWNGAGLLCADASRDILSIVYNWISQSLTVGVSNSNILKYEYTCGGELLSVKNL